MPGIVLGIVYSKEQDKGDPWPLKTYNLFGDTIKKLNTQSFKDLQMLWRKRNSDGGYLKRSG